MEYIEGSLRRILATHTVVVGLGEDDGIFVINDEHGLRGAEIDLLQQIFSGILRDHHVREELILATKDRIWGSKFMNLLETDGSVDVLAAGISINDQRRKEFAIDFTEPTYEFYQTLVTRSGTAGFSDGKLAVDRIGALDQTTNEALARRLLGQAAADRLKLYEGSGAYATMLDDLAVGRIDGVILDRPYALQMIDLRKKRDAANGVALKAWDFSPENGPDPTPEKVGFAVRMSDEVLLREINAQLAQIGPKRRTLMEKCIPGWRDDTSAPR